MNSHAHVGACVAFCTLFSGCSQGTGASTDPATGVVAAASGNTGPTTGGQATSGSGADELEGLGAESASGADSRTFAIHAVAGHETGLVKLAEIDDRIDTSVRFEESTVRISGNNDSRFPDKMPGLLYDCKGLFNRTDCHVYGTAVFMEPGIYDYSVEYKQLSSGDIVSIDGGQFIVSPPEPFVVVSVGDSVASGEGNPVKLADGVWSVGYWDDFSSNLGNRFSFEGSGCHRSSFAGPALAGEKLAARNDVTFIHISCSGASFGMIQPGDYETLDYRVGSLGKIDTQLYWLRERFEHLDVLMLSGGANNVGGGFGKVVASCIGDELKDIPKTDCTQDTGFIESLRRSITELPAKYDRFAALLNEGPGAGTRDDWSDLPSQEPQVENRPEVVAITEYFDPTRNAQGVFPSEKESKLCTGNAISNSEWELLYNEMVVPLNQKVFEAADRHGWVYVGGIADAFRTHGYCSSGGPGDPDGNAWVVTIPESIDNQGDAAGTAHPDRIGQTQYGDRLYDAIVTANPPRTTATATTAGQPYEFSTWVNTDVEVTLMSYNPIAESGISGTEYSVGEPQCNYQSIFDGACRTYTIPFYVKDSGRHTISFFARNNSGAPKKYTRPVEVWIDKDPPVMTCVATPGSLWPPNNKLVEVEIEVTAVDEVSGAAEYWLSATADSLGQEAEAIQGFELGTADVSGELLAKRLGSGPRHYTLTYASADHLGNTGYCDVTVTVPHDQKRKSGLPATGT